MNQGEGNIRIIPLGGCGEIGKNMMLIEQQGTMLIIDAGMMFPDEHMPGVDFVIPDLSYVLDNRSRVTAIILTHGHEDHIGALPYLLREINAPVYGTKLTLGFARILLEEHSLPHPPILHEIIPRQLLSFGDITAEFFRVCHSVADGVGIAFHTPIGIILHSGDFKFDYQPVCDHYFDFYKLAEFGEKGVFLLMSDSTNAELHGYTPSERELNRRLFDAIDSARGRVIVVTFASNIHRIQQIFDICGRAGRKIAILGRSMDKNITMAEELGYLRFDKSAIIPPESLEGYRNKSIVILTTGSQGEPMSVLSRIAAGRHKLLEIEEGDTVIFSSSIIPGNEKTVSRIVNSLFRQGALVYYEGFEELHVSGHASREELKLLIAMTRPKYFLPLHGEFRHLIHHANLAKDMGIDERNIIVAEDGDVVQISRDGCAVSGKVKVGHRFIGGKYIWDLESGVLRDRHNLSEDGIVIVVIPISLDEKGLVQPEILSKGFISNLDEEEIITKAKDVAFNVVRDCFHSGRMEPSLLRSTVRDAMRDFFMEKTSRHPVILPIVVEV